MGRLLEWAEWHFSLVIPNKDGTVEKEHLERLKQSGRDIAELEPPCEFPKLLSYIWAAFSVLNRRRSQGMNGPNPITFMEVDSWIKTTDQVIKPKDVETILKLDDVFLKVLSEKVK